jgi:hypothetical protein
MERNLNDTSTLVSLYDNVQRIRSTSPVRPSNIDDNAGKPESIYLMIGRRPYAAFGNSTGDQQMLEYTRAGNGARLAMIVLHGDNKRESAYAPAQGLPDTKVGTFTRRRTTAGP